MPDTGSASGESSEGRAYSLRNRGEPVADEPRMTDPLAAILKELRLMKKEMAANKAEFDQKLVDLTQEIRASTESDSASTARQTTVQPTEGPISYAAVAQPVAEMPRTSGSGESPAVVEVTPFIPKYQRKWSKAVSMWAMAVNTLRH